MRASPPPSLPTPSPYAPIRQPPGALTAYELMRGVGNLRLGAEHDPRHDARRPAGLLIAGPRRPR